MIYDDDTGRRVHYGIGSEERTPAKRTRRKKLPSPQVQADIIELARRPGWNAERIHAWLRQERGRHDISLKTIRRVIARARAGRRN